MRSAAVTNHKGGSGKTTTVVSLAAALGELGRRVLVVDLDPQGSSTSWLGQPLGEREVLDAYLDRASLTSMARPSSAPGVQVVPSSSWLVASDRQQEIRTSLGIIDTLERAPTAWDDILVDCPPSQGALAAAALVGCATVIVPIEARALALTGVVSLLGTMDAVRERLNPRLRLEAMIACRVNRTRHAREVVDRLRSRYPEVVLEAVVRESIGLAEAPSYQLPITRFAPDGAGATDYRAVAVELIERERATTRWAAVPVVPEFLESTLAPDPRLARRS